MDALLLARIQFAFTIGFHFIFPPISIGLAWLLVVLEWRWWKKNDQAALQAAKWLGKLLAITFVVGVASGIVMEFQFGTNWAEYSKFVGDIFGAPLAAEGVFAFFLESTFLGVYLFARERVSKRFHWISILLVALGTTMSAFWILVANSWQQTPTAYHIVNGRAELTSFWLAVFNPSTLPRFFHVMIASLITGSFFAAGVAAWHLLKTPQALFARVAMKWAVVFGLIASIAAVMPTGHWHALQVAQTQPAKFATIEGLYETQSRAPMVLFGWPTDTPPTLHAAVKVPALLSLFLHHDVDSEVMGLDQVAPEDRPPLWLPFVSFHLMVALGLWFILIMMLAALQLYRGKLWHDKRVLYPLLYSIPLPIIACQVGWIVAEVGRQPWVVYGVLRTKDSHSLTVSAAEVGFSLALFVLMYSVLFALWLFLIRKHARLVPTGAAVMLEGADRSSLSQVSLKTTLQYTDDGAKVEKMDNEQPTSLALDASQSEGAVAELEPEMHGSGEPDEPTSDPASGDVSDPSVREPDQA